MGLPIAGWGRRQFLQGSLAVSGLGLLAGCGIVPPRPQPTRVDRIRYLGHDASLTFIPGAFVEGLQDLGYVDGQNAVGSV